MTTWPVLTPVSGSVIRSKVRLWLRSKIAIVTSAEVLLMGHEGAGAMAGGGGAYVTAVTGLAAES